MAQKSCPSGAPILAATASIAVTPGTIVTSSARHSAGPASIASQTAAAMAKTPGSPPETTATRSPSAAFSSAACAREISSRLSDATFIWSGLQLQPVDIGSVAVEPFRRRDRLARLRRHLRGAARPEPDDGDMAAPCLAHGFSAQPGTSTMEK